MAGRHNLCKRKTEEREEGKEEEKGWHGGREEEETVTVESVPLNISLCWLAR